MFLEVGQLREALGADVTVEGSLAWVRSVWGFRKMGPG